MLLILFIFQNHGRFTRLLVALVLVMQILACGGSTNSNGSEGIPPANAVSVHVSNGINRQYANLLLTSVTVCRPGSSFCKTIDNVLVDTGSTGLRLTASALSGLNLPALEGGSASSSLYECTRFASGYAWGALVSADVKLAQRTAGNLPIQIMIDHAPTATASECAGALALVSESSLGANGILGVGASLQDCGTYCASIVSNGRYFQCTDNADCLPTTVPVSAQIANPVSRFSQDNNGVMIQLPDIGVDGSKQLSGLMVFGINTQANNMLPDGVSRIALATSGPHASRFTAMLGNIGFPDSLIDSGSGAYFFDDPTLATCANGDVSTLRYCPGENGNASVQERIVTMPDGGTVTLLVGNALYLLGQANVAYKDLAAPARSSMQTSVVLGLSFFYGRQVFTGFESPDKNQGGFVAYKSY